MNRKFSLGICISLVAIASAITFVLTMTFSLNMYNSKIAGVEEREQLYTKMQEMDTYIRSSGLFEINKDILSEAVLDGYTAGISDPNARYLTASEYYEQQQAQKGKIVTAGLKVEREESGYIKIAGIYEGSSAYTQSVNIGDVITHINNDAVLEIGADEAVKRLSGEEGTRLAITVQRKGEEYKYTLIRQLIEVQSVYGTVTGEYGYIKINNFTEVTAAQFETIYSNLREKSVKGIIFDVRGTGGVLAQPLREILNGLVGSGGVVATAEYKGGITSNIIQTEESDIYDVPIIVLTDKNTSMMGELFAAVLKDYRGAQLVGAATSGNNIIPRTQAFRDGSAIIVSYMRVKTAKSANYNAGGLKPEYIVELNTPVETDISNLEATLDAQIIKALEILTSKTTGGNG